MSEDKKGQPDVYQWTLEELKAEIAAEEQKAEQLPDHELGPYWMRLQAMLHRKEGKVPALDLQVATIQETFREEE